MFHFVTLFCQYRKNEMKKSINNTDMKSQQPVCQRGDTVDVNIEQPKQTYMVFNSLRDEYKESSVDLNNNFFKVLQSFSKHFSKCFRVSSTAFQRNLEKHWQQLPQANLTNEFV